VRCGRNGYDLPTHSSFGENVSPRLLAPRRGGRLAQRVVLVAVLLLVLLAPFSDVVDTGPRQTVQSINPKIGVHTRLTDEVEEIKIKRTLEMVREMGATWIVEYFPWAYSERRQGSFDWTHADMVVEHANTQGLKIIARLGFVPEWARPEETFDTYLGVDGYEQFGDYVYAFVQHFRGSIDYIIVWNEPNLSLEWGYRPVDPEGYTALLRIAYVRAKDADPNITVLGGALAPTVAPPGSEWGMDDLVFLQRMYDVGASESFDALAVHAYGWRFPPEALAAPDAINFSRTELLRQVMVTNGDGQKPIFITEGGWNDHPRWTKGVSASVRAENTVRAYQKALDEWEWCESVCLWAFRFPWPSYTYRDNFSFVTTGFSPRLVYEEVRRYAVLAGP